MRAITCHRYGPPAEVLTLEEVEVPIPLEGEVLIRVRAASVNPVEWHFVRGEPALVRLIAGLRAPKDPFVGGDGAGVVESVGPGVTAFAPGDEVFGTTTGSLAEFARAKTERIALKPAQLTFEQASTFGVAGCTALQAVRDHGQVKAGQHVLILGAAGGVGSFAVQIAKALGAEVTGVCSTANLEFVRHLGADHVVDYTVGEPSGTYDVVLQVAGNRTLRELRQLLTAQGILVMVGSGVGRDDKGSVLGPIVGLLRSRITSRKQGKRVVNFIAKIRTADLETLAQLATPQVSRVYTLEQSADALADIESGHVRGKLVVTP